MSDPATQIALVAGSYLTPSFEQARVVDAMRPGVISCPPDTSMGTVARIMASNHVHAVVVTLGGEAAWGVITDAQLMEVADASDRLAGSCARLHPVTLHPHDPLPVAVERMREQGVTHAVVVDPEANHPLGVLSSLDVAGVVAWGRG